MTYREMTSGVIRYGAWALSTYILRTQYDFGWIAALSLGFVIGVLVMIVTVIAFDHLASTEPADEAVTEDQSSE